MKRYIGLLIVLIIMVGTVGDAVGQTAPAFVHLFYRDSTGQTRTMHDSLLINKWMTYILANWGGTFAIDSLIISGTDTIRILSPLDIDSGFVLNNQEFPDTVAIIITDSLIYYVTKATFDDSLNNIHIITAPWKFQRIDVDTLMGLDSAHSALWTGTEFRGEIVNSDSLNLLGANLPYTVVDFGGWQTRPTSYDVDTLEFIAGYDSTLVATKFHPSLIMRHPDTCAVLNSLEAWSGVFEVPPYFVGADSIVFNIKTGHAHEDSNYVKVSINEWTDGTLNLLYTSNDTSGTSWVHLTATTLTALTRYDKFVIVIEGGSITIDHFAMISRMYIYWKEGS